ncbi:MAG: ribonuclease E/G [Oscillospiraceae bacterium]|nr:ribonuclease E/G [Oscillospiraceae bacterium]
MTEVYIDSSPYLSRIVVLKNNKIKEFYIDDKSDVPKKDEIYKGVVRDISRGLKCAFVDIGNCKKAYLYLEDSNEQVKKGDEILVQVQKVEKDGKKAKVTTNIILTGEKVILTNSKIFSISKNYKDKKLGRAVLNKLIKPLGVGMILRTNSFYYSVDEIQEEFDLLLNEYNKINKKLLFYKKPALLYDNYGILGKVIRDNIDVDLHRIVVDNEDIKDKVSEILTQYKHSIVEIKVHNESMHLFKYYGIEKALMLLYERVVPLNCGGEIVINKTEAMYVIDVNSKRNVKERDLTSTIYKTNIEAAEEIAKQITLRNLNGIILIDFIDDDDENRRNEIIKRIDSNLKDSKSKYTIFPFTDLNLLQITRKDAGFGLNEYLGMLCPCCKTKQYNILNSRYLFHQIYVEIHKINDKKLNIFIPEIYRDSTVKDEIMKFNDKSNVIFFDEDRFKVETTI